MSAFSFHIIIITEKLIEDRFIFQGSGVITLVFAFTQLFPHFLWQRFSLEFLSNPNTEFYADGFKTELKDTTLGLLHRRDSKILDYETRIYISSEVNDDYDMQWSVAADVIMRIRKVLETHWKCYGSTELYVLCPSCPNSSSNCFPLINPYDEPYADLQDVNSAQCEKCGKYVPIKHLRPPPNTNIPRMKNCKVDLQSSYKKYWHLSLELPSSESESEPMSYSLGSRELFSTPIVN